MKRIVLIVMTMMIIPVSVYATPFLVCDPQAGVTHYKFTGPAWIPATTPAQTDGSLKLDIVGATVGANSLTVAACRQDAVWGELCSSTVPFSFTRPSPPTIPANIKLVP